MSKLKNQTYMDNRQLRLYPLPPATLRAMQTRPIVFLTPDQLVNCLDPQGLHAYMNKVYNWLWGQCHAGPLWLSQLTWAYVHQDGNGMADGPLLETYQFLTERRPLGPGF